MRGGDCKRLSSWTESTLAHVHCDSRVQLRARVAGFVSAYHFTRHLKTLRGLAPDDAISQAWSAEPGEFTSDPLHQMPGRGLWRGASGSLQCAEDPVQGSTQSFCLGFTAQSEDRRDAHATLATGLRERPPIRL